MAEGGGVGRLSLDELIALNEEIAALVRAGVPLERGLVGTGRDLRGRLGRVAEAVGRRMEAEGCSLAEAVAAEGRSLPELYGAVVAAGIAPGRVAPDKIASGRDGVHGGRFRQWHAGADPAQLKVWMMGEGTPEQTKFLDTVEAGFKARHPNTDVQIKYVPWPQVATTFQKAAAGGEGPDVTELGNTDVQSHIEQGNLADITKEFGGWADGRTLNRTVLANDQAGGKTYAVPWYGGVRGVWYRTDWFRELNISQPKTWAELTAAA